MGRRRVVLSLGVVLALLAGTTGVEASQSSRQIVTKHDHTLTFTGSLPLFGGYHWDGFGTPTTSWTFKVHAKEAADNWQSRGTVHMHGENLDGSTVELVGKVTYAEVDYWHWAHRSGFFDVLFLAGTTSYEDMEYYFMYLESEKAVWLALNTVDFAPHVASGTVWSTFATYRVHSLFVDGQFDLPEKPIR